MPAVVVVQAMSQLMVNARLVSDDEARVVHQRWLKHAADPEDAEAFRRFLVDAKVLTAYQAALLAHGRTEGYFIGPYRVLDRIGQGRMAGVYRATSPEGRTVALKVLPPSKADNTKLLARFRREARMMTQLDHPNVVRCYECAEWSGLNYIAMEFLDGETLAAVLQRRNTLPVAEAVRVIYLALVGLQHLHEKGLIHRDMKPANLMLVPAADPTTSDTTLRSNVKILDIGLGRQVVDESRSEADQETQLTGEGVLLGTPDYWSPEQARDSHAVDIRSDIYGLGCVLYHCLTGQPPFPDTEMLTQIIRHVTEPIRPMREFNTDVPDGLQQVLNFMMAKDVAQRYPTPERAAKALQLFLPVDMMAPPPNVEVNMAEKKPEPKPTPTDIPVGKLVTGKGDKPAPTRAKPKTPEGPPAAPAPATVPTPATAPLAAPPVTPAAAQPEYDVELVAIPCPPPVMPRKPRDQRRLFELDRRDFIMMGAGVGGALVAILSGLVLAKALQRKPEDSSPKPAE